MSDGSATKGLRERLTTGTEDKLGRALTDLLENPLLTGAIGRAFDARERAAQAQELAMGALNLPSATDIERLTRRLRSLSQRLEGIEDGVDRLGRSLTAPKVQAQLERIEQRLEELAENVGVTSRKPAPSKKRAAPGKRAAPKRAASGKPATPKQATARSAAPDASKRASTAQRRGR